MNLYKNRIYSDKWSNRQWNKYCKTLKYENGFSEKLCEIQKINIILKTYL